MKLIFVKEKLALMLWQMDQQARFLFNGQPKLCPALPLSVKYLTYLTKCYCNEALDHLLIPQSRVFLKGNVARDFLTLVILINWLHLSSRFTPLNSFEFGFDFLEIFTKIGLLSWGSYAESNYFPCNYPRKVIIWLDTQKVVILSEYLPPKRGFGSKK